jgi:NAD(P)-dependent dehydrogenase (short-subunit alcohol dehydrogenase family)
MRSIVITGISSGIGLESARHAIRKGARVFGSVRDMKDAARLAAELGPNLVPLLFDVRDEAAVKAAAAQVREALAGETLMGLVSNAGIAQPGPVLYQPIDEIRQQIETNLVAGFTVAQAFGPLLGADRTLKGPPGRVVIMSSIAGMVGQPFMGAYVASKHGLEGLSDVLRRELMMFGIDVIAIGPAPVDTPIWDKAKPLIGRYDGTEYGKPFDDGARAMIKSGHDHSLPAGDIAALVWEALTSPHPRPRYAPAQHKVLEQWLPRILPRRWFDRLAGLALGLRQRPR